MSGLLVFHTWADSKSVPEAEQAPVTQETIANFIMDLAGAYMLRTLFFSFEDCHEHLAPGRSSLYDLCWDKFWNRPYDDLLLLPDSTMTHRTPL